MPTTQACDAAGREIAPASCVLPILKEIGPGQLKVVGTGFYITRYGLLATAKHVLEDLCDLKTLTLRTGYVFQDDDQGGFALRRIEAATWSNTADVGIAQVENRIGGAKQHPGPANRRVRLSLTRPPPGDRLVSYAYPENKVLDFRDPGHVPHLQGTYVVGAFHREVPSQAHPVIPHPHFETTLEIRSGASGCPIFSNGFVVAIACRGWDFQGGEYDGDHLSSVVPVTQLLPLEARCASVPPESWEYSETPPSRRGSVLTFAELVAYGHVDVGTFGPEALAKADAPRHG
jgi:hypothetical protein